MIEKLTKIVLSLAIAATLSVIALPRSLEPGLLGGSEWHIEVVDSRVFANGIVSIAVDRNSYPHISYADDKSHDLKYAKWTGSQWGIETVDSWGQLGHKTSIALDSNDYPHISYCDLTNYDLKYAVWDGTSWTNVTVDFADEVGYSTSIALDNNDEPHIGYTDFTNFNLKYATKAELAPLPRSLSLDIDPDTLNLKSRGRWITAYLSTEIAKAEDLDALSLLLNDVIPPVWWDIQDDTTLMVKFDRAAVQAIVPVSDSVDIKVTGQWKDGESFEVHDTIRVINPGR